MQSALMKRLAGSAIMLTASLASYATNTPSVSADRCAPLAASACPTPLDETLPDPKDMLSWDPDTRVVGFRNTYRLYPGDVFHAGPGEPYPLPTRAAAMPSVRYDFDGHTRTLDDYLHRQSVTGLLIIKNGEIAYEYYGRGNTPQTLWTSRSVAKSVVSTLVGIAVQEGLVPSIDVPLTRYLPELRGSAWDGVSLRQALQHTSGIAWNEDYADPASDFAALTRCEASADPYPCVLALVRSLKRVPGRSPGQHWAYNTGGAWLVGRALERATGMSLAKYLETRLWRRFPMEHDGVWQALVPQEIQMGGHGFNATLRDWGRFALFVAHGGKLADGTALLPAGWLEAATQWTHAEGSITPATPDGQFGYQWWHLGVDPALHPTPAIIDSSNRVFWAQGIYGQNMAIDRSQDLLMVQWSVWEKAEKPDALYDEQALFFSALEQALDARQ